MSLEQNPYASPTAELIEPPPEQTSDAELIRRRYVKHEASVKSIGILYYLGGAMFALSGIATLLSIAAIAIRMRGGFSPLEILIGSAFVGIAAAMLAIGRGLRTLRSWVRIPVVILSILGLLQFPMGTLINGYILFLVLSGKSAMVFSDEYKEIIRQTPHVKYRTSIIVWILLAILVTLAIVAMLGFLLVDPRKLP